MSLRRSTASLNYNYRFYFNGVPLFLSNSPLDNQGGYEVLESEPYFTEQIDQVTGQLNFLENRVTHRKVRVFAPKSSFVHTILSVINYTGNFEHACAFTNRDTNAIYTSRKCRVMRDPNTTPSALADTMSWEITLADIVIIPQARAIYQDVRARFGDSGLGLVLPTSPQNTGIRTA